MYTLKIVKNIFLLFILCLVIVSCKKDPEIICNDFTELSGQHHLVDISSLINEQAFKDTLQKYPQLQVYQVINDEFMIGMHCNVFYKDIMVLSDNYFLGRGKKENLYFQFDKIVNTINLNLQPGLTYIEAIKIARQSLQDPSMNSCLSYRLCIYDINCGVSNMPKDYKLVWKIQATDHHYPYVVLDANTGEVYTKDNGWRN
jgi:hypothetical protein